MHKIELPTFALLRSKSKDKEVKNMGKNVSVLLIIKSHIIFYHSPNWSHSKNCRSVGSNQTDNQRIHAHCPKAVGI